MEDLVPLVLVQVAVDAATVEFFDLQVVGKLFRILEIVKNGQPKKFNVVNFAIYNEFEGAILPVSWLQR